MLARSQGRVRRNGARQVVSSIPLLVLFHQCSLLKESQKMMDAGNVSFGAVNRAIEEWEESIWSFSCGAFWSAWAMELGEHHSHQELLYWFASQFGLFFSTLISTWVL
ncbi:unnamed protein product, partial [Musa acuminata subsp. malaccensis]